MLTLNLTPDRIDWPAALHARKDHLHVKREKTEFSQQTADMLAVRDQRDRAAFASLFDYFAPRLKGFFMRSGTTGARAEDIVQDVMLTVWRKADQFDPTKAQVSTWVYQIAKNRQIDILRKEARPLPEALKNDAAQVTDSDQSADQILAVEQEALQLKKAIAKLGDEQREMIEKAYLGELTHQDIKAQTGLPLGTIKSRIRLGLERLRHELKDMR